MTTLNSPELARSASRRSVLRAAAWSVPAVSVVAAAPAYADSTGSTLVATWNNDSFRTSSGANFTAGVPVEGTTYIGVRVDLSVTGTALTDLTAVLENRAAAPNGFTIPNHVVGNSSSASPTTTWPANQGALVSDGWSVSSPAVSSTQATSFTFTQADPNFTSGRLRFTIGGFAVGATTSDFPATLKFSASGLSAPVTVTITSTSSGRFVTGS